LEQAMAELTADQRQVLMLRFVEDWSLADTAQAMQRSVGAVKALQFRAIQALGRALELREDPS
jgi:RNA polymerase sigma-70 factor (ECF subfamily)